jgi:hypothetical protein
VAKRSIKISIAPEGAMALLGQSTGDSIRAKLRLPVCSASHKKPAEELALFQPVTQKTGQICVEFDIAAFFTNEDRDRR